MKLSKAGRLLRYLTIATLLLISLLVHYFLLFNYLYYSSDENAQADAVVVSLGSFYELFTHAATGRLAFRRVRNSEALKALEKRLLIE